MNTPTFRMMDYNLDEQIAIQDVQRGINVVADSRNYTEGQRIAASDYLQFLSQPQAATAATVQAARAITATPAAKSLVPILLGAAALYYFFSKR